MSHFTSLRNKITNKELLKQALSQQSEVKQVKENWYVRGYNGQAARADVVAILNGEYDLGFVLKEDSYAIADFSLGNCGAGDRNLVSLWQRIVASYNTLDTYEQAAKQRGLENAHINVVVH